MELGERNYIQRLTLLDIHVVTGIQSIPTISESQGGRKKKFELAGFRNNWASLNNEFFSNEIQYGKRH